MGEDRWSDSPENSGRPMALTDDKILRFLAPQVRDFGGQTEIEGAFG